MANFWDQYSFGQNPTLNLFPQQGGGLTVQGGPSYPAGTQLGASTQQKTGDVLGEKTSYNPSQQYTQPIGPPVPQQNPTDLFNQQQSQSINSGWDAYTSQLNDMLNVGLPGQRTGQEQIANAAYNQGVSQLGTQKATSEAQIANQQAANLKDLSANVRNLFTAGNTYLGARGAGDSSAANQYSYAVTKMGTKGRGDIQAQASDRLGQIKTIYDSETNRLESEKQTRLGQIADWFNAAQNQLRGQLGQAGLGRGRDLQGLSQNIYNTALQAMQQLQAEQSNRRSSLEQWAMNNSKSVQQLIGNMQNLSQLPASQGLSGGQPQMMPQGGMGTPVGYGTTETQKRDIFGNIIG